MLETLGLSAAWAFVKQNAGLLALGAVFLIAIGGVAYFYHSGVNAGKQQVQTIVEKEHTQTIKEVRNDEQLAQSVADKTGVAVSNTIGQQTQQTQQTLEDIQDALKARPALPAGCPADVAPSSVLDRSNALVAQANRAAGVAQSSKRVDEN